MVGVVLVIYLVVVVVVGWLFYVWGASIAEKKGRSRSLGWFAVFFGLLAILILYVMSDESGVASYAPVSSPQAAVPNVAEQIGRLAQLRESGALTQAEFDKAKADALAQG